MTERVECCICGAETGTIRIEMFRYRNPEPGHEYAAGPRCLDRDRCQAMAAAMERPWDIDDGPASLPRIASRRAIAAPVDPPQPDPDLAPEPETAPTEDQEADPPDPERDDREPTQIGLALQLAWSA